MEKATARELLESIVFQANELLSLPCGCIDATVWEIIHECADALDIAHSVSIEYVD